MRFCKNGRIWGQNNKEAGDLCSDGRIWGQTNKSAGSHLGIKAGRKTKVRKLSDEENKERWKGYGIATRFKKGMKLTKEHAERLKEINRKRRGEKHQSWRGGPVQTKCIVCEKLHPVMPLRIKKGEGKFCSRSCVSTYYNKHQKTKNTSIEIKVEGCLKRIGIKYESQRIIPECRTVADFYIPEQRLVIFADGDYWHSLPKVKNRDQKKEFLLGMNGFKVLRLSEGEINTKPVSCFRKISKTIKQGGANALRRTVGQKFTGKD